jgi:hypothetical protein
MSGKEDITIDAPLVFVGYGAVAPEEKWDDYKGVDVKGKILVMMVNDPQPTAEEPNRFAGKAYTYYGRWMYKYEEALRQGAAGALLIHTTPSASYDWSVPATSFSHERFHLAGSGNPLEGWVQEETARALFAASGFDLDALRAQAERRDFRPVDLKLKMHAKSRARCARSSSTTWSASCPAPTPTEVGSGGLLGPLGPPRHRREQARRQYLERRHRQRLRRGRPAGDGAGRRQHPAKRTQVFLWPAGEETGFLGSNAYIRNPAWPLDKTSADLNLDSMNFVGKTRDIGVPAPSAAACTRRPRWWQSAWA